MCGIFGIMYFDDIGYDLLNEKIKRMSIVSKHRGPDQSEVYVANRVALGMNRLSIIAPEESSAIQKHLSSRRYAVINGEITNYRHVKSKLKNKPVHKCDSAVILPSYEEFGQRFVEMLAGMFAIAIYDEESHSFQLWRDPLGIKPLYYYHSTECVIFASEIKMIYAVLDNRPEIEFSAIDNILRYRLNPGRSTVFKGIQKVLPGETVLFKNKGISRHRYWSLRPNEKVASNKYSVEEFRELFGQVIRENSHADVPGGFFTSGGLDSSLVTAVALQEHGSSYKQPISIKFSPNSVVDEQYGQLLESYLDTKFEWVTITDQLARETLHEVVRFLDEPLENPIHVGTYLMSKRAKEIGLKSVLTGDGSDEFFLGYERHGVWYNHPDPKSVYPTLHWTLKPGEVEQLYAPDNDFILHNMVNGDGLDIEPFLNMDQSLLYERGERLPEYHNMRLDRMTMAHGIEAKVPFLDHRIVEYSLNLPTKLLFGSHGKDWLKQVAAKWLPEKLIHREKVLFPSLPNQWLLGKGAEWAADILLDPSAKIYRYLRRNTMEQYISQHKHREVLRGKQLWALISLELWLKQVESWEKDRVKQEIAYS